MTITFAVFLSCIMLSGGGTPRLDPPVPVGSPPTSAAVGSSALSLPGSILFGTVFDSLADPEALPHREIAADVWSRIETFSARAATFHSRLPEVEGPPGPEAWLLEKRHHMERDIFALVAADGIAEAAADYAREAVLAYEWEGMSDGPLGEAAYAEQFLRDHPDTPLRSYLVLFLAHRLRSAYEILQGENDASARDRTKERYQIHLEAALQDPDPLVRFVARDLEQLPFVYLPTKPDPRGSLGPDLALREALDLADKYVAARGIDLTGQYLQSVTLRYDESARALYWHLQWMWRQPRLGMEYGLHVYMDGKIVEVRLGP